MVRHIVIAVFVLVAALAPLAALAADMEGKVQSVDTGERTFTLDNGTKVWLAEGVAVESIKEGDEVTVSYDERDGKPVATSVTPK
jgi:Cu/Ag efflux protein CusF